MVAEGAFIGLVGMQAKISCVIWTGLHAKRTAYALFCVDLYDAVASLMACSCWTNVDTGWFVAVVAKSWK